MRTSPHRACYFVLSEAEVSSLIRAATSFRNRTILRALFLTGLRRQELCNLSVEDVVLERSRLLIRAGKGDKSRVVPIPESLVADLRAYVGRRTWGPLLLSQKGGGLSTRTVNYVVEQAGKEAQIHTQAVLRSIPIFFVTRSHATTSSTAEGCTSCRRSSAMRMLGSGMPPRTPANDRGVSPIERSGPWRALELRTLAPGAAHRRQSHLAGIDCGLRSASAVLLRPT